MCVGDIHAERGLQTQEELRESGVEALFLSCDVSSEEDFQAVAQELQERWGGVDVVVNNAGIAHIGKLEETPLKDWDSVIDINLLGVVRGCKAFLPTFKRQGQGHFVNIASMAALLEGPKTSVYNVTKAGVVKLSETLRMELARDKVQVTVVCPYFVRTNLAESLQGPDPKGQARIEKLFAAATLTAQDIADSIFSALETPRFWVVPHKAMRYLWYLKCCLPLPVFTWLLGLWSRARRR